MRAGVGMTGEVTLQGRVLPIGGVKQKVLAAHRAGLTTVVLPARNGPDLEDVPEAVRDQMTFHLADHVGEVLAVALARAVGHAGRRRRDPGRCRLGLRARPGMPTPLGSLEQTFGAMNGSDVTVKTTWREEAACKGLDTGIFFPSTRRRGRRGQARVRRLSRCVRTCLEWALASRQEDGVWGGLTDTERRRLRRRRRDAARRAAAGCRRPRRRPARRAARRMVSCDAAADPTEEIVEHLFALVDRLRGGFETAAAAFDLSVAQAKALRYVAGPARCRCATWPAACAATPPT